MITLENFNPEPLGGRAPCATVYMDWSGLDENEMLQLDFEIKADITWRPDRDDGNCLFVDPARIDVRWVRINGSVVNVNREKLNNSKSFLNEVSYLLNKAYANEREAAKSRAMEE